jgi:hypothetical protein
MNLALSSARFYTTSWDLTAPESNGTVNRTCQHTLWGGQRRCLPREPAAGDFRSRRPGQRDAADCPRHKPRRCGVGGPDSLGRRECERTAASGPGAPRLGAEAGSRPILATESVGAGCCVCGRRSRSRRARRGRLAGGFSATCVVDRFGCAPCFRIGHTPGGCGAPARRSRPSGTLSSDGVKGYLRCVGSPRTWATYVYSMRWCPERLLARHGGSPPGCVFPSLIEVGLVAVLIVRFTWNDRVPPRHCRRGRHFAAAAAPIGTAYTLMDISGEKGVPSQRSGPEEPRLYTHLAAIEPSFPNPGHRLAVASGPVRAPVDW